jgi:hypothetical protein
MATRLVVPRVDAEERGEDAERDEAGDECEGEHVLIMGN